MYVPRASVQEACVCSAQMSHMSVIIVLIYMGCSQRHTQLAL